MGQVRRHRREQQQQVAERLGEGRLPPPRRCLHVGIERVDVRHQRCHRGVEGETIDVLRDLLDRPVCGPQHVDVGIGLGPLGDRPELAGAQSPHPLEEAERSVYTAVAPFGIVGGGAHEQVIEPQGVCAVGVEQR